MSPAKEIENKPPPSEEDNRSRSADNNAQTEMDDSKLSAPPSESPLGEATPSEAQETPTTLNHNTAQTEPMIDPELMSLPNPPQHLHHHHHHHDSIPQSPSAHENGNNNNGDNHTTEYPIHGSSNTGGSGTGGTGIAESIAQAPNPRPTDFNPNFDEINNSAEIDISAIQVDDEAPGSPTSKILRAIAPPNAVQGDQKWPTPPPNASVNLYIGRALLAGGNDNWPLKPNDIVNWIRKNYPEEWDGDEGRCSAHRVRTYLARKGADMYYEKLNQGCIAGWRIRQNHLWRFENGGFQGRGMKQEEAIAAAHKENEAIATAAHKAAAAEALAAGHPSVKTSMSLPGINDGSAPPVPKRPRTKVSGGANSIGGAGGGSAASRRKSTKKELEDMNLGYYGQPQQHHQQQQSHDYGQGVNLDNTGGGGGGPSDPNQLPNNLDHIDPSLGHHHHHHHHSQQHHSQQQQHDQTVNMDMVHQAMQAAAAVGAGQMDELDMGMQLPIEMQMHSGEHDGEDDNRYRDGGSGYYGDQSAVYQDQFGGAYYGQTGYTYQHGGQ